MKQGENLVKNKVEKLIFGLICNLKYGNNYRFEWEIGIVIIRFLQNKGWDNKVYCCLFDVVIRDMI